MEQQLTPNRAVEQVATMSERARHKYQVHASITIYKTYTFEFLILSNLGWRWRS